MSTVLTRSLAYAPSQIVCNSCRRAVGDLGSSRRLPLYAYIESALPSRRVFSSIKALRSQKTTSTNSATSVDSATEPAAGKRRKPVRSPAANTSLRRVAVEAQRSRDTKVSEAKQRESLRPAKLVTAYAVAERFDLAKVADIVRAKGFEPDPANTGLYPQVLHVQVPVNSIHRTSNVSAQELSPDDVGDIFIFPSGTLVTWNLPEGFTSYFATRTLLPATENAHVGSMETEDLEYFEDPARKDSDIQGDTIIIGTKNDSEGSQSLETSVDKVLTKVALSSGFARSTKLAVLETMLTDYIESTRNIPTLLSKGSRLPFNRAFILRKTGQLLSLRAHLNLYSELTDSLPDMLWDSRQELKLEGYYDRVGRELDVGIRIKVLNEKMDYAQEIASVLRERLSEKHGLVLEWTIIILIAVEVGFEILRLWKEARLEKETTNKAEETVQTSSTT